MAGQAKSSLKARLRRLGATAGKPHGYSNMYKKKSLPGKNAGRDVGFTIEGGKARKRADRMANGGPVRGRKGHHTTNIVISAPGGGARNAPAGGGGGAPGVVQHVHRHIAAPGVPIGGPGPGPIIRRPVGGLPPAVGAGLPVGGGLPPRPPIGGPVMTAPPVGAGMKSGGVVRKRKIGGDTSPGKGYRGFPHSPTTEVDSAVSARKRGGKAGRYANGGTTGAQEEDDVSGAGPGKVKRGGKIKSHVKKRQMGGPMTMGAPTGTQQPPGFLGMPMPGRAPLPPQQGAPNLSGRPARPAQPLTVPMPPTLASMRARPAPGTTTSFKRGGHADEAEDKKLFKRMYKEEEAKEGKDEKKRKRGGIAPSIEGGHSVLGAVHSEQHISKPPAKSVQRGQTHLPGEKYKSWGVGKRKRGGLAGDSIQRSAPTTLPGDHYKSWGTGHRKAGGTVGPVNASTGSSGGLGRLAKAKSAEKIPDKTEA